ncbi:MAG TPA: hypothetical protein PLF13_01875 [candidate division Zixibacteria bacterium]|nr:hypothetical protein [candidate division Zixibacteria bacterium]
MESFLTSSSSWLGLLGSIGLMLASQLATRYVIPFLKIGKRQQYAGYIATIADEVTDDLRTRYPDKDWLAHLDEAIDSLISICGISSEIAQRAVSAAVGRKTSQ